MITALGVTAGPMDDEAFRVDYNHGERDWWIYASYTDFGEDFRADSGFRPRVGFQTAYAAGARVWWPDEAKFINRAAWGASVERTEDSAGALLDEQAASWFNLQGPRNSYVSVFGSSSNRVFSGIEFDVWNVDLDYRVQATANMRFAINAAFGDWIDFANVQPAERRNIRPSIRYQFGRHLSTDLGYIYTELDVGGGQLFRIHAPELRLIQQFNAKAFVRLILQ